jgi:hypothetical protein
MDTFIILILVVTIIAVIALVIRTSRQQEREAVETLHDWLYHKGYRPGFYTCRASLFSPFWLADGHQLVFYIEAQDQNGVQREGWAQIGVRGRWDAKKIEVKWNRRGLVDKVKRKMLTETTQD